MRCFERTILCCVCCFICALFTPELMLADTTKERKAIFSFFHFLSFSFFAPLRLCAFALRFSYYLDLIVTNEAVAFAVHPGHVAGR